MFNLLRYNGTIDFLKYSWLSALFSLAIFSTFIGTYLYRYNTTGQTFNYSVDFTGGIEVLLRFNKPVNGEKIVQILEKDGWPKPVTREFEPNEHLVRIKRESKNVQIEAQKIKSDLEAGLGNDYKIDILRTDAIGGATGSKLWSQSFWAILIALLLMLFYIAARFFSGSYAMGAIVSLFHDAVVILTIFLLLDKEISINVIGAILAVLGYSINDTIVIFSRVRDNVAKFPSLSMREIINKSITETLSRTVLTTVSTLLVVVSLFIFGGETLRDLAFALLIGIVFGIYSTIFIANPILLLFYNKKSASGKDKIPLQAKTSTGMGTSHN